MCSGDAQGCTSVLYLSRSTLVIFIVVVQAVNGTFSPFISLL